MVSCYQSGGINEKIQRLIAILQLVLVSIFITACAGGDDNNGPGSGSISGFAMDASTDTPLENVHVVVKNSSGTEVASADTGVTGAYFFTLTAGQTYSLDFSISTHYPVTYSNIEVLRNEENILAAVLQIDTSIVGSGTISGTILDSITGTPVAGATLNFREGINVQTGTIIATTTTDSGGVYTLATLVTGNYTCEIILTGYNTAYASVVVIGGTTKIDQNSSISPKLTAGITRIVLEWGATPLDLDAHLTGPNSNNAAADDRFHISWLDQGDFTVAPFVGLDVDDTDSFGPETITIASQYQGTYRYSIHDYSNFDLTRSPGSTALANSSAKVTVYQGTNQPRVFNVPAGVGVYWTVFELNGSTITPINTMTDIDTSLGILSESSPNDAALIRSLPQQK